MFFAHLLVFRFSLQSLRAEGEAISLFLPTVIARPCFVLYGRGNLLSSSCHPEPTLRRLSPSPSSHCEPKVEQSPLSPSLRGGRSPRKQSPLRSFKQCILIPHTKTKKLYQYVALTVSAQMFYFSKRNKQTKKMAKDILFLSFFV